MRNLLTLALAGLLLFSAGCKSEQPTTELEKDLTFLCSDACAGRLPGTPGNEAAQDYIEKRFQEAGLEPLAGYEGYAIPYTQQVFGLNQQTLTATFADGSTKIFHGGEDFYPWLNKAEGFSGPVTTDPNDPDMADRVYLGTDRPVGTPLARVLVTDAATAHIGDDGQQFPLKLNETVYQALEGCTNLSLDQGLVTTGAEVNNVVGVLKGTVGDKALILSAHFDHVGGYGETVYRGALDNASGTATLLELLRDCAAREERPTFDLIFCAFNGEDMGLQGSTAFTYNPLPYEAVNAINLDALGWAGEESLGVSVGSNPLAEEMESLLTDAGFTCEIGNFGNSDHNALNMAGIPAVTIASSSDAGGVIHTPEDTLENVNQTQLEQVAQALCKAIPGFQFVEDAPTDLEVEADRRLNEVLKRGAELLEIYEPERDEMIVFQAFGNYVLARENTPHETLEEFDQAYPEAKVPKQIGDYRLNTIYPGSYCSSYDGCPVHITYDFSEDADYQEGVYPLDDAVKYRFYTFEYTNSNGASIDLEVISSTDIEEPMWADSTQTRESGEAMLSTAVGPERAVLQSPGGETMFILDTCPQSPLEPKGEVLVGLLNEAKPALFEMQPLP